MPKNRKDEKLESSRVEVSLELLLKGAKKGYTIDELVGRLDPWSIAENMNKLLDAGANPYKLMSRLRNEDVTYCLETRRLVGLLLHGVNPDQLVSQLTPRSIVESLDELLMFHAKIDVDKLVSRLDSAEVARYLDKLLAAGAKIDVDELVDRRLWLWEIARYLDKLLAAGAKIDVNELVGRLNSWETICYLDRLLAAGADPELLQSRFARYLDKFLAAGVDPELLRSRLDC